MTIRQLKALDPQIAQTATLLERFARILRQRDHEDLELWLQEASEALLLILLVQLLLTGAAGAKDGTRTGS